MKILVAADLHVDEMRGNFSTIHGVNSNWVESFARLEDTVDAALDNEVDCVVLAGDIFSTGHPLPEAVYRFLSIMRELKEHGIETYVLPGNHEYDHVSGGHHDPLETFLSEEPGFHVSVGAEVLEREGVLLAMLPWHRVMGKDSVDDVSKAANDTIRMLADKSNGKPSLLFGHVLTDDVGFDMTKRSAETVLSASSREPIVDVGLFDVGPWSAVRLGHVHKRQTVGSSGKAMYVGSTYRVTVKEADEQKGCEIITINDSGLISTEYIPFKGRMIRNVTLTDDNVDELNEIVDSFQDGDIVTFQVDETVSPTVKRKVQKFSEKQSGVIMRKKANNAPQVTGKQNNIIIKKDDGPAEALKSYLSVSMPEDEVKKHLDLFSKVVN